MNSNQDIFRTVETRCWREADAALVLSFEHPRPRISTDVLRAIERALAAAERLPLALVITSATDHFAFGADLDSALAAAADGHPQVLDAALEDYQRVMLRVRDAAVPVVAAVRGYAVSGGCELLMHCTRVIVHSECRIGLLEASAGVVPSGGGLKELARRASEHRDVAARVLAAFDVVAAATLARSGTDAQRLGFLTPLDYIDVAAPLGEAISVARRLLVSGYEPPSSVSPFRIAGRTLLDEIRGAQRRRLDAGELTPHQLEIDMRIAAVLTGGDTDSAVATEAELLALERSHFVALAQLPLSQARYAHLRATGKRLIN